MRKRDPRQAVRRVALCGLLTAMMLVLGYIEHLIPLGVPGIKLGLSNSVLLFALYMLDIPTAFLLMLVKVFLSGLLFSGVTGMMYAFAGGLLSLLGMTLLYRLKMHTLTVSMVGGLLHNVGQVALAMLLLSTPMLLYYMAVLMLSGLGCGALTGICAASIIRHLKKQGR